MDKNTAFLFLQEQKKSTKRKAIMLIYLKFLILRKENGSFKTLAVLNINNMIPVTEFVISKVDLHIRQNDNINERQRKGLLQKELKWCRENCDVIQRRVQKVYSLVVETPDKNRNLTRRCCNFKKLEAILEKHIVKSSNK